MPYILIDAVGIKQLFRSNRIAAIEKCQQFWQKIKTTALYDEKNARYVTFSDTALVFIPSDTVPQNEQLVSWIEALLNGLKTATQTDFYAIVNSGEEAGPSMLHDNTAVQMGANAEPHYIHIAGLGDAFTNLFYAEDEIRKRRREKSIPLAARIYVHESLMPPAKLGSSQSFTIQGLGGCDQTFYCVT